MLLDVFKALLSERHASLAFKTEWLGDNTDSQNALITCPARNDRCRSRTRSAAHSGRDEDHVRAVEVQVDFVERFFSCGRADLRSRTGAKAGRGLKTQLNAIFAARSRERLCVRVRYNELDALQLCFDHIVDRVSAGSADSENYDSWL